ncbi:MAG: anion permease [Deltaproteobacteria bacterium]|nr:anion permease [Deltaproteobacteria bacterium]
MTDLADTIRNIPLFSGLPREDIAKVLGKLEEKSFASGTTIFCQGDKGDSFYFIQSGAVQVVLEGAGGRSESIAVLGPQDWFGEMALLSGEPRSATIITVKDSTVWRLSRESWDELIDKHPTWLLHFCATLSKRLSRAEQQYSKGRDAFITLAEEFYNSRPPKEQQFFPRLSLLVTIDPKTLDLLLQTEEAQGFLANLEKSQFPLIRPLEGGRYELHGYFRDFLEEKLIALEGREKKRLLHAQLATQYERLKTWDQAIHHSIETQDWPGAARLLVDHKEELLNGSAPFLKSALERIPPDYFFSDLRLVHIKADTLAHLGDFAGAARTYKEVLSQRGSGILGAEAVLRYQKMADILAQKKDYTQVLNCLRSALNLIGQETATAAGDIGELYWEREKTDQALPLPKVVPEQASLWSNLIAFFSRFYQESPLGRWMGGILGLLVWGYLWFWTPDIGLEPAATKQVALLCLALIYWILWVVPEHGTALILALGLILTGLGSPETVLSGFASTTWFMSLGVLGLGAAITGSGLFYRLSLQLVRFFPLTYYWQTVALAFMGVVITALIPQKSARATIISQMILNLSESLGYKTPSKASTGLFAATFLGLGQLNFLYLTGATATLLAWGLLPADVRAQFTWGYWFLAAFPPTLVVIAAVLLSINFLYQPESQARVSYKMVHNQLQILGPLSREEWITLAMLCFTVSGWLTFSYHGIHGAWISLIGLCVLINTGVLGWGMLKKGIDWEFLIYLGATLSIPSLLTNARVDEWLARGFSPLVLPFVNSPAISFIIIALIAMVLKLVFTTRLTVITLSVALVPLSTSMGISPWIMTMIILVGAEAWFFRFQVDWHTLAYATTEGKGFSYPLMCRVNPFFALAYILALLAGIPYWRYLGLIG